jgi:hypothetical protein
MYDRLRDLIIEAQFGSRPGGDGTGQLKGAESRLSSARRAKNRNTRQGRAKIGGAESRVATERNRLKGIKDAPVKGRQYRSDGDDEGGAGSEGSTATHIARLARDPRNATR